MGVTITAKNSKFIFDMGSGGFFNLRKNIALALDEDFGNNYAKLINCRSEEDYAKHDDMANNIIQSKHLDRDYASVIDFLYAPDTDGKVNYKTCKQIYDLISPINFGNKSFRYSAYAGNDYEEFKQFLLDCYSRRRSMVWH